MQRKILVSHETPTAYLSLFAKNAEEHHYYSCHWNDYEYCLVHLFEDNPDYYNYYKEAVDRGVEVVLDNSIFELGKSFDENKYLEWIGKLQPTWYIIPDVMDNKFATVSNFKNWIEKTKAVDSMRMGVVHGTIYDEIVDCYKYMVDNADYIAFSYVEKYFEMTGWNKWDKAGLIESKRQRQASGRQALIARLIDDNIWNENKPHHLLGCALAREFSYYVEQKIKGIRSIDTADPIMAAINGLQYITDIGLNAKPNGLLADHVDFPYDIDTSILMLHNTQMFKRILSPTR